MTSASNFQAQLDSPKYRTHPQFEIFNPNSMNQSQDTCFNTFRRSSVTNWKPLIETKVIKFRHLVWQNRLEVTRVSFLDQTLNISIVCPSVSNTVCIHIHSCTAMYTWLQSCDSIDMIWYDSWPQIVTLSRENGVIQIL